MVFRSACEIPNDFLISQYHIKQYIQDIALNLQVWDKQKGKKSKGAKKKKPTAAVPYKPKAKQTAANGTTGAAGEKKENGVRCYLIEWTFIINAWNS